MQEYKPKQNRNGRSSRPPAGDAAANTTFYKPASGASPSSGHDGATRVQPSAKKPSSGGGGKPPQNKKSQRKGKKTAKYVLLNLLKGFFVLCCVGVMLLSMLAVSISKYVVETTADDDLKLNLYNLKLPQNSYILAWDEDKNDWVEYQKFTGQSSNSIWVPLEGISPYLKDAVIATEDKDFEKHNGFSWYRTIMAAVNEVFHFQTQFGASTLDQQLVKNLTGDKDNDYRRKIREIFRAIGLNNQYPKDMILEAYLNTLPLSGTIVGVQAAATEYFYKDVADLTLSEAALIAGITKSPGTYNPFTNPDNALKRRNVVLGQMLKYDKITQAQYDEAVAQPLGLYDGPRQEDEYRPEEGVTSYFTDAVFEEVVRDLVAKGIADSREGAIKMLYTGGLRIEATVDLKLQAKMEEVYALGYGEGGLFPESVTAEVEVRDADGNVTTQTVHPQSTMAVMNYDGELVGVVGGMGEKTASLSLNRATQSPRPVGSTMKPIATYALGIDYGLIDYSRLIPDLGVQPRDPSNPKVDPETGAVINDWPRNYSGDPTGNLVPVSDAIAQSLNTVPVRIATWLGKETLYEFLRDTLEISTLSDPEDIDYSPLVLGGMHKGITAYELAAAYTIFGGEDTYGVFNSAHCYRRVLDASGNVIMEPDITTVQAISPEAGFVMNRLLSNVLRANGGTARGMALDYMDSVAKTGTTTDDFDRWFVGLTPYYVSAVWWGYDTNIQIKWSPKASTNPPPVVWKNIMEEVQADKPEISFPDMPQGVSKETFCRDSGQLAGPNCTNTQTGYYISSDLPEICQLHADGAEPAA